jgi:hypothetical protein
MSPLASTSLPWLDSHLGDKMIRMSATISRKKTLRVGAQVSLRFGRRSVRGTLIEDRGLLGVGGRRLWRVRLQMSDVAEPIEIEVPESDLSVAA